MNTIQCARRISRAVVLLCVAVFASASPAYELVVNGGFEQNAGVGSPALTGWTAWSQAGSQGGFLAQSGNRGPITKFDVPAPPAGSFAAMNDQPGPGTHVLYQDVAIPVGAAATFSARLYVRNAAEQWATPSTLDFAAVPNQQVRVDVVSPGALITDIGAGVLRNVYRTQSDDPRFASGYVTVTSDLSAFAGQTIRLRFAAVDNRQSLLFGVDAVSVSVPGTLPSSIALTSAPSPSNLGSPVTINATIIHANALTASGGVNFLADNILIAGCSNVVPVNNVATCVTSALTLGQRTLRADFAGDSNLSASSATLAHTVITTPGAPTGVSAEVRSGALAVSFVPPASNGGAPISGYTVTCTPTSAGASVSATGASSPIHVMGLVNGTTYQCSVVAVNAAGNSAPGTAPNTTPSAITAATLVTSQGSVIVSIVQPVQNCSIAVLEAVSPSTLPAAPLTETYVFPYGLLRIRLTGCTVGATVSLDLSCPTPIPASAQYWKYGRTSTSSSAVWSLFPYVASGANTVRIALTDGGAGDDDQVANGTIDDPGGLAISQAPIVVPMLGIGQTLALLLGLAFAGFAGLRRSRRSLSNAQ